MEFATLDWVCWYNKQRLLEPIGYIPPVELEQMYYLNQPTTAVVGWSQLKLSPGNPGRFTPALFDACWSHEGHKIDEQQRYYGGQCNPLYPNHGDPRMAAGAPLASDILKCSLKPVDPNDYSPPLTPEQLARLKVIFSKGLCDYSHPGIQQRRVQKTWQKY